MMATFALWTMLAVLPGSPVRAEGPPPPPVPAPVPVASEPLSNAVKGLELPAPLEVDPRDGYVHVRPKWGDGTIIQVEWSVTGTGPDPPKFTDLGPEGLIVGVPAPGEPVILHAAALIQPADPAAKPWMTRIARTVVVGKPAIAPATVTAPATTAPPGASQGLSVVLVFDAATTPPELTGLIQSPTLRAALAESGSRLFAYDKSSPVLVSQKIKPVVDRAKTLPVVVLIGPGGKQVLPAGEALPLPLTGNAATTEAVLLGMVAGLTGDGKVDRQ